MTTNPWTMTLRCKCGVEVGLNSVSFFEAPFTETKRLTEQSIPWLIEHQAHGGLDLKCAVEISPGWDIRAQDAFQEIQAKVKAAVANAEALEKSKPGTTNGEVLAHVRAKHVVEALDGPPPLSPLLPRQTSEEADIEELSYLIELAIARFGADKVRNEALSLLYADAVEYALSRYMLPESTIVVSRGPKAAVLNAWFEEQKTRHEDEQ